MMTVKELIAELQQFDPELPVLREDAEWDPYPLSSVTLEPDAIKKVDWVQGMEQVKGWSRGEEITVEVPKLVPHKTHFPGVVLS